MSRSQSSKKVSTPSPTQTTDANRPDKTPSTGKPSRAELVHLTEKVTRLVEKDPGKAAKILADWLNEGATKKPTPIDKAQPKKKSAA